MHELETLYREVHSPSVKMMSRILKGDWHGGEDVVQEAFARAWKFYPTFDPDKGKLRVWFNAILFNSLRDYQRDARIGPPTSVEEFSVEDVLQEMDISDFEEKREFISRRIEWVQNPYHREVLHLFFILGYTSTEISQIVSKTTPTNVTTIVNRFKERIKSE